MNWFTSSCAREWQRNLLEDVAKLEPLGWLREKFAGEHWWAGAS